MFSFEKMNAQSLTESIELAEEGRTKEKVYICNHETESSIKFSLNPELWKNILLNTSIKEKQQIKKEWYMEIRWF